MLLVVSGRFCEKDQRYRPGVSLVQSPHLCIRVVPRELRLPRLIFSSSTIVVTRGSMTVATRNINMSKGTPPYASTTVPVEMSPTP